MGASSWGQAPTQDPRISASTSARKSARSCMNDTHIHKHKPIRNRVRMFARPTSAPAAQGPACTIHTGT
eukprot:1381793-Pyramimonas_sp.AAC.1